MKDTLANMAGQLEKNDMTKAALQKLCEALKTQVNLKDEENTLKLQEETKKRIEIAKNFESTMGELTKLIETHSSHNSSLKEENLLMANKLEELLREYEQRENKIANVSFILLISILFQCLMCVAQKKSGNSGSRNFSGNFLVIGRYFCAFGA